MKKIGFLCLIFATVLIFGGCVKSLQEGTDTGTTAAETEAPNFEDSGTIHEYQFDLNLDGVAEKIRFNQSIAEMGDSMDAATFRILDGATGAELWREKLSLSSDEKGEICIKRYNNGIHHRIFYYKYKIVPETKELFFSYQEFYFNKAGEMVSTLQEDITYQSFYVGDLEHVENNQADLDQLLLKMDALYACNQEGDNLGAYNVYVLLDNTGKQLKYSLSTRLNKADTLIGRYQLSDFYIGDAAQ